MESPHLVSLGIWTSPIFVGGREQETIQFTVGKNNICCVSQIGVICVSIEEKLDFNNHAKLICSKTQIPTRQRLTA